MLLCGPKDLKHISADVKRLWKGRGGPSPPIHRFLKNFDLVTLPEVCPEFPKMIEVG